jgi:hypothetical protein
MRYIIQQSAGVGAWYVVDTKRGKINGPWLEKSTAQAWADYFNNGQE